MWSSALAGGADTIVARASGPGAAALAVIRLSGSHAAAVAAKVCPEVSFGDPWRARLASFRTSRGQVLERGVAIPYRAPRSYTGEDMLEAMVHGSPYLVGAVVEAFVAAGARPAEPGEFTRRALANGKLDLVQAEAIRDLVAAETAWQARNAREQLEGVLSRWTSGLRADLTALAADLEAGLDFAEQEAGASASDWRRRQRGCLERINAMVATAAAGERIRDGVRVVILGPPNAGKSTLFNHLLGRERAIVSPHPGTTRDTVEADVELGGLRVVLVDTAGLREGGDEVEAEGVRRSRSAAAGAAAVLQLWPADAVAPPADVDDGGRTVVRILSKCDLGPARAPAGWLGVSCVSGAGLASLRARLERAVAGEVPDLGGEVAIAARHRLQLERAASELERCDPEEPELAAEGVRWALRAVDELTGTVTSEDLLDRVFATFCIGK